MTDIQLLHVTAETMLAALVWVLYRRQNGAARRLAALEAEQGLARKRTEAATGGLHIRLLGLERSGRQAAAPAAVTAPLPPAPKPQLNRGELDLLMKVRQLTGNTGIPAC